MRVLHRNTLLPCDNLLDSFDSTIKVEPIPSKKQNEKTVERQTPMRKYYKEEESATREESDVIETEEMIECTARKIQMFSRNEDAGDVKDKEGKKIDSSVETKKAEQEQDRNDKMIFVKNGFELCDIEDEVRIESSNERPGRIEKIIYVEDGRTFVGIGRNKQ